MYFIYADEYEDPGLNVGESTFFIISGLIVHETHWNEIFQRFLDLRRNLSRRYGISQRIALRATEIVNEHGDFHHIQYNLTPPQRFSLYREVLEFLAQLPQIRILNVFIRKDRLLGQSQTVDVFETGWTFFIQRFHNYLERGGHLNLADNYGLLFTDRTHDDNLRRLTRRMRAFNYVPSQCAGNTARRLLVTRVLDDPIPRASPHSYYIQLANLAAFALARRDHPRTKLSNFRFHQYFDILTPVLLTEATRYDYQGIVYWPR
ncbi:MAG: DUF3800 domain-containing protein [Chloroflexales bacterium]|nr:DUF3800 domain-containing protein [Chloroflexales bacterium]